MFPILIGSNALAQYGYTGHVNDFDLIVDNEIAKRIFFECDKKIDKMAFFSEGNSIRKVDVILCESEANKYIFEICNKKFNEKHIVLFGKFEVIVPPLEVLYMIKKSHIHRILQLTANNQQDLEIWKNHMKSYLWMRSKLNYVKMDSMLYGDKKYGIPLEIKDQLTNDDIYREIFIKKFDDITKRSGDTPISMEKTDNEFFNDRVERFIDHDELHRLVAQMCRQSNKILYEKYKKDKSYANLDMELFLNADPNERIQCIREEIMVLFLERKWIPEMIKCYVETDIEYKGFNVRVKKMELDEVIAHYATNLCGQGHSWLRQFVLDHYHILSDLDTYDLSQLEQLVLRISTNKKQESTDKPEFKQDVEKINSIIGETIEESKIELTESKVESIKNSNEEEIEEIMNAAVLDHEYLPSIAKYHNFGKNKIGSGKCIFKLNAVNVNDLEHEIKLKFCSDKDYSEYMKYFKMIDSDKLIFCDITMVSNDENETSDDNETNDDNQTARFWIYSVDQNFGFYIDERYEKRPMTIFNLCINGEKNGLSFSGKYCVIGLKQKYKFTYDLTKNFRNHYYYSELDPGCGWRNPLIYQTKYLSSYGSAPYSLNVLFEKIARYFLNLPKDITKDDMGSHTTASTEESYDTSNDNSNEW
jgi:hypothetical protein